MSNVLSFEQFRENKTTSIIKKILKEKEDDIALIKMILEGDSEREKEILAADLLREDQASRELILNLHSTAKRLPCQIM